MRSLKCGAFAVVCAGLLSAAPSVKGIYNGASWLPPSLPNSGIAQGAIFTITGTGLGPAALQQAQAYPLPTTQGLGGTTIQATVGSVTETCIMIYTADTQVAAILPSATPTGTGTLSINYQGASSSVSITVVAANFGTFTLNEAGSGPGVFTDLSYNPITLVHPANPGQTLVLWGTGLGPVTGNETEPPAQVDLATGVQVYVGGQLATVGYGGRGSSPGLDQINFTLPAGVGTGCRVSVAVLIKGITGNVTTMAIAPAGQATCSENYGELTAANLQDALNGGSISVGAVELSRIGSGDDILTAGFGSYPLNNLIRSYGGSFGPSIGSCTAYEVSGTSLVLSDPVPPSYIDGGPSLVIQGPAGAKTMPATSTGEYSGTLGAPPSVYIEPGAYTVTNGNGGAAVGAINWTLTAPAAVVPTNLPSTVTRSQNLTLTWSGGAQFPIVTIFGSSGLVASSGLNSYVEFICNATGSAGSFTIPSVILNLLPANGYGAEGVPGVDLQIAGFSVAPFTGTAAPGLASGFLSIFTSTGGIATIQ